ncbi:hypothetical protein FHW16_001565 [Phyllobacterium myrsinacearum]|uniref:Phosphoribosyltransferase n=1 Tax=Phyllobacterium myrsinacearum TaxID=28101 RepID=A0A839ECZ6_9HYPH|nr:hypothetical protein [Phyllobacterium myrsinacearum]
MRGSDYNAILLVKAVKGHPVGNGYTNVSISGKTVRIQEANKDDALKWFGAWAATIIDGSSNCDSNTVLVPIPNSSTVVGGPNTFRTAVIAQAIKVACSTPTVVAPYLKWDTARPRSTDGDSRRPELLFPHLVQEYQFPAGRIVLIDDVYTTGGHFIASTWRIEHWGRSVDMGICCGRTEHVQLDHPFKLEATDLAVPARV